MLNKEQWVDVMAKAGISEEQRNNWHREFEARFPQAHEEFLKLLGIDAKTIKEIRAHFA